MGDLTTLVRQKTTRKQNGRLVSYTHRYNIFHRLFTFLFYDHTYFDWNFLQDKVIERSEILGLQIILLAHRVHLEIDHACITEDDKTE